MSKPKIIILLLAFALLVQNTCPMGAAGKTTVGSNCGKCAMKQSSILSPDGLKRLVTDSTVHFPLYVFSLPKNIHTFHFALVTFARPLFADSYEDALPNELLRPPRA